jgi:hypothetical protein
MRAIGNNLIPIITGLGLSAAALGGLAVALGAAQFAMAIFKDDTKEAKDELKELEEQAKVTGGVISGELSGRSLKEMKQLKESLGTLVGTFDALSEGISSSNAAQSRAFSSTLSAYAEANDLSRERVDLLRAIVDGLDDEIFVQETLARVQAEVGEQTEKDYKVTNELKSSVKDLNEEYFRGIELDFTGYLYEQEKAAKELEERQRELTKEYKELNRTIINHIKIRDAEHRRWADQQLAMAEFRKEYALTTQAYMVGAEALALSIDAIGELGFNLADLKISAEEFGSIWDNVWRGIVSAITRAITEMLVFHGLMAALNLATGGGFGFGAGIIRGIGAQLFGSGFGARTTIAFEAGVIPSGDIAIGSNIGNNHMAKYGLS